MKLTDVTVTRTIPATAEKTFEVWMNPKSPGGPRFGAERAIMNPVMEELFYLAVQHAGRAWPHYGRFVRIDRPHSIEYIWVSEATKGAESAVTLELTPRGDETEVTLHHAGVPDDEMGRQHKIGWAFILNMLAEGLAARRSASPSE